MFGWAGSLLLCMGFLWASLVAQLVKNHPQCGRPGFDPWVGKIPQRRERLPTPGFWPGEFHGLYSPWGHKKLDMTEPLSLQGLSLVAAHRLLIAVASFVAEHRL